MKKILLTMLLASAFCMAGKAQDFKAGVIGGYNLSTPSAYDSQSGFHVGLKGELGLPRAAKGLYVTSACCSRRRVGRLPVTIIMALPFCRDNSWYAVFQLCFRLGMYPLLPGHPRPCWLQIPGGTKCQPVCQCRALFQYRTVR